MKNLYKFIRTMNLLVAIIPVIALYRATVQPAYNWGLLAIEGTGRSADYQWLLVFSIFAWASFILERWYKRQWYYVLPLLLFCVSFGTALYGLVYEASVRFQGDAWKISFDMGLVVTLLLGICFFAVLCWSVKDYQSFIPNTWSADRSSLIGLSIIFLLGILILYLFSLGRGGIHTNMDRLAVALTVIQGLSLAFVVDNSKIIRNV